MIICSVDYCNKKHEARGYCKNHYRKYMKFGDPLAGNSKFASPEDSFKARTVWRGDCLIWTGGTSGGEEVYGRIWVDGGHVGAHRYAWEREHGTIPEGMVVDHKDHCSTLCCNVAHLRLASRKNNTQHLTGPPKNNTSGHRNVSPRPNGTYQVQIGKEYIKYNFGTYTTIEEATRVAEEKRLELFGEFAGKG